MFHVGLHVCNIIYCVNPAYYLLIESINQSNFSDRIPQFCSFLPVYNVASYDIWHYYAYVNWYMWMSQYQTFILQHFPSPPLDNIWVMVIVLRLRGNIIRTALCWIVWHNVHSPQHTYVSSSYRSNRLGLSHWDPYAVHRGSCLELYYCNMVEWLWWDSSLIFDDQLVSFSALTL